MVRGLEVAGLRKNLNHHALTSINTAVWWPGGFREWRIRRSGGLGLRIGAER
jgi:hypothetical protein